jgi:hypothetical protein
VANHCIDLLCLHCGANWCCRCGDQYRDWEPLRMELRRRRFTIARMKETKVDDKCPQCGQQEVVLE